MATNVSAGLVPLEQGAVARAGRRVSWGAIFAGVVIAVAVQLLLGILGTGIGLSMVYRTIQLHDGHIEVQSTPGRGTTFTIRLPQAA